MFGKLFTIGDTIVRLIGYIVYSIFIADESSLKGFEDKTIKINKCEKFAMLKYDLCSRNSLYVFCEVKSKIWIGMYYMPCQIKQIN